MEPKTNFQAFFFPFGEKLVNGQPPSSREEKGTCLANESFSFSFGFCNEAEELFPSDPVLEIDSPIQDHLIVHLVEEVACTLPFRKNHDEGYLISTPSLVGDLLKDPDHLVLRFGTCQSALITYDGGGAPGTYLITARIILADGRILGEATYELVVLPVELPPLDIHYTNWMHYDGIASYYGLEVFSPRYMKVLSSFLECAVKHGMDTLLVPMFTPALDTAVNGERLTTQLVDVEKKGDVYSFSFDRLIHFLRFAQNHGVKQFEMSHLFTQWGAEHAPKILDVHGNRLFGWDTDSQSETYLHFLSLFLDQLTLRLESEGFEKDQVFFHLSDEPNALHVERYRFLKNAITPFLHGYPTMDALSEFSFAQENLVDIPAVALESVPKFLQNGKRDIYVYHCCAEDKDMLPNRFLSMPLDRLRVLGTQLYFLGVKGLLHWGYNFYNSGFSKRPIDPYLVNDAEGNFPSGDSFIVYPGRDEKAKGSLRLEALSAAFHDYRAFRLLESRFGRERVVSFLKEEGFEEDFSHYPAKKGYLADLRNRVNEAIAQGTFPRHSSKE